MAGLQVSEFESWVFGGEVMPAAPAGAPAVNSTQAASNTQVAASDTQLMTKRDDFWQNTCNIPDGLSILDEFWNVNDMMLLA